MAGTNKGGNGGGLSLLGGLGGGGVGPGAAGDGGGGGDSAAKGGGGGGGGFGGAGGSAPAGTTGGGGGGFGGGGGGASIVGASVGGGGGGGVGGGGGGGIVGQSGGGGGFGGGGSLGGFGGFGSGAGALGTASKGGGGGGAINGGAGAGMGGAIFQLFGTLQIINSTLTNNQAIVGTQPAGTSGALGVGGGVFCLNCSASVLNSTLAGNRTSTGGADAGGAFNAVSFGQNIAGTANATLSVTATNSILADSVNMAATPAAVGDLFINQAPGMATLTVSADDVVESDIMAAGGATVTGTATKADPKLAALADNGGPTPTMALQMGSPANDIGRAATCTGASVGSLDQRGMARGNAVCDSGAYENKPNGSPCGNAIDCGSGYCTDGVCCESACGDSDRTDCQACNSAQTGMADGKCAAANTGVVCRPAAGPCDKADSCNGTATTCPGDSKQTAGFTCRQAAGVCDQAEVCDGSTDACPANRLKGTGVMCKPPGSSATCDPADFCDGIRSSCPARFAPYGTSCGTGMSCNGTGRCL